MRLIRDVDVAQDGHRDFHTAPELWLSQFEKQKTRIKRKQENKGLCEILFFIGFVVVVFL